MEPIPENFEDIIAEPKKEMDLDTLCCFICLNHQHADSPDPCHQESGDNDNDKQVYKSDCVKTLTSYIIQSPLSSHSTRDVSARNKFQASILSSVNDGKAVICSKCLSKAENLLELHKQLEEIQMKILSVLRNFQDYLRERGLGGGGKGMDCIRDDIGLPIFQDILLQEFMNCEFYDGRDVPLKRLSSAVYKKSEEFHASLDDAKNLGNDLSPPEIFENEASPRGSETELSSVDEEEDEDYFPGSDPGEDVGQDEDYDGTASEEESDKPFIKEEIESASSSDNDNDDDVAAASGPEEQTEEMETTTTIPIKKILSAKRTRNYRPCKYKGCSHEFIDYKAQQRHYRKFHGEIPVPRPKRKGKMTRAERLARRRQRAREKRQERKLLKQSQPHSSEPLTCEHCEKTFKNLRGLKIHTHHQHFQDQVPCPQCSQTFKGKSSLGIHLKYSHGENSAGEQVCDVCGKVLKDKYKLKRHILENHSQVEFVCEVCSKQCKNKVGLDEHKKWEHGSAKQQCPHCPKSYTEYAMAKHIRKCHGAQVPCQFCGKVFRRRETLKKHEELHRNAEVAVALSVPFCKPVKFIHGQIRGKLLVCEGYVFRKDGGLNKKAYFFCIHKKQGCKAHITVHDFDQDKETYSWMESKEVEHNHPVHPEEVTRWEARSRVKELLLSHRDATTGELVKKIKEEFGMDSEEARAALGKHGTFKRFIIRARNKQGPRQQHTIPSSETTANENNESL